VGIVEALEGYAVVNDIIQLIDQTEKKREIHKITTKEKASTKSRSVSCKSVVLKWNSTNAISCFRHSSQSLYKNLHSVLVRFLLSSHQLVRLHLHSATLQNRQCFVHRCDYDEEVAAQHAAKTEKLCTS